MRKLYQLTWVILGVFCLVFAPPSRAEPSRVWVDPRIADYKEVYDSIAAELQPGDGIVVQAFYQGPAYMKPDCTQIIAFMNYGLSTSIQIYGGTSWPDHKTAVALLTESESDYNIPRRIVKTIDRIHLWQSQNPRSK